MKQIIMIEGLPGSGKTTFARKISAFLSSREVDNVFYAEGDLHPVDLAWIAILTKEDLSNLLKQFPSLKDEIFPNMRLIDNRFFLAYTKVSIDNETKDFYEYCQKYEIYRSLDANDFFEEHRKLWNRFIEEKFDNDFTYVFECILLQNHINQLILQYVLKEEEIINYFQRFKAVFQDVNMKIYYIKQMNHKKTLDRIIEERRTNNKELYKDWIDHVIEYLESFPISKVKGYMGYNGVLKYMSDRMSLELKVLMVLGIDYQVFELDEMYETVLENIKKDLS